MIDRTPETEGLPGGETLARDERRAHRRLSIRLPVECRRGPGEGRHMVRTVTQDISTGGMYFELDHPDFSSGDEIDLELTMPAAEGVFPYEGRASCPARIIRVDRITGVDGTDRFGMAVRFSDRLRLRY